MYYSIHDRPTLSHEAVLNSQSLLRKSIERQQNQLAYRKSLEQKAPLSPPSIIRQQENARANLELNMLSPQQLIKSFLGSNLPDFPQTGGRSSAEGYRSSMSLDGGLFSLDDGSNHPDGGSTNVSASFMDETSVLRDINDLSAQQAQKSKKPPTYSDKSASGKPISSSETQPNSKLKQVSRPHIAATSGLKFPSMSLLEEIRSPNLLLSPDAPDISTDLADLIDDLDRSDNSSLQLSLPDSFDAYHNKPALGYSNQASSRSKPPVRHYFTSLQH